MGHLCSDSYKERGARLRTHHSKRSARAFHNTTLTTVVNKRRNIGQWQDQAPPADLETADRQIAGGPRYDPNKVLALLNLGSSSVYLWTRESNHEVTVKLEWDLDDVAALVKAAIQNGRFIGSEWCAQKPGGPVAACDAYSLKNIEWNAAAKRDLTVEYYVKFAISLTGAILLICSCHTSRHA